MGLTRLHSVEIRLRAKRILSWPSQASARLNSLNVVHYISGSRAVPSAAVSPLARLSQS